MPAPAPTPTKPMATHDDPPDPSAGTIPYGDLPAPLVAPDPDHPLHKDLPVDVAPVVDVPPEVAPVSVMSAPGVSGSLTTYVDENGAVVSVFEATPTPETP